MKIDLRFPASATEPIAADHGYELFGSLSRVLPWLHDSNNVGVHPICGEQVGARRLKLSSGSSVVLRIEDDRIAATLSLVGESLNVGGVAINLDAPTVLPLLPLTALRSRLVTIKKMLTAESFVEAVRRQLQELNVADAAIATLGKRRTVRVRDKEIVGYELLLEGLTAEESLAIQEQGLGGRRHMGCGLFHSVR